jgi:hypothetical protein
MQFARGTYVLLSGVAMLGVAAEAIAESAEPLPGALSPVPQNYAQWVIMSLGLPGVLMLLSAAGIFVGAWFVVFLGRRPAVIASYMVFLLLPLLLAAFGALKGCVSSFGVIALAHVKVEQWQIFMGLSEALILPMMALTATIPSYLVLAIGLFVRTLCAAEKPAIQGGKA